MNKEVRNNCLALQAVGTSMKGLLGPSNSIKCYITGESHDQSHDGGLLLEPSQIVEALTSLNGLRCGHPINQLLYESCQGQQKECGCGITTLVLLSAFWSEGVMKAVQEGVPLPAVFALFEESLQLCDPLFNSCAISMETVKKQIKSDWSHDNSTQSHDKSSRSHDLGKNLSPKLSSNSHSLSKIKTFSRHLSSASDPPLKSHDNHMTRALLKYVGSRLAHGKETAMDLAVEAVGIQCSGKMEKVDISRILHHCVVGKGQSSSRVVGGVLVEVKTEMTSLFHDIQNNGLSVLVVEGDCTPSSTHPGLSKTSHVTSHDPMLLYEESSSSQWLTQCAAVIEKFNIGLLVVGGAVSPLLWEHCLTKGVVVLTSVQQEQREAISQLSGATPLYYLQYAKHGHVGEGVSVELVEGGWAIPRVLHKGVGQRRPIKTYSCCINTNHTHSTVVTAMLCGSTESTVDLSKQNFQNSLHRLNCALSDGSLLPGGGAFEAICVRELRQAADKSHYHLTQCSPSWMLDQTLLNHWRPVVYQAIADGLVKYIATVLCNVNPEMDGYIAMVEAERMVSDACGGGVDCEGGRVFDVVQSKQSAWKRALELLRTVGQSVRIVQ